jgi:hypothetical protein
LPRLGRSLCRALAPGILGGADEGNNPMRLPIRRPPPTVIERLLGRRRARLLRRRCGLAFMGMGFMLVRPRASIWRRNAAIALVVMAAFWLVLVGALALP